MKRAGSEAPSTTYIGREEMQGLIWEAGRWAQQNSEIPVKGEIQIAGIARGGLILAFYLSKILGGKVYSIPMSSYETGKGGQGGAQIRRPVVDIGDIPANLNPDVVAEDLVDTGDTLREVRSVFPEAQYMALYSKIDPVTTAELLHFCGRRIEPGPDGQVPWLRFYYDDEVQEQFPDAPV